MQFKKYIQKIFQLKLHHRFTKYIALKKVEYLNYDKIFINDWYSLYKDVDLFLVKHLEGDDAS
jgi:hypothetical protein